MSVSWNAFKSLSLMGAGVDLVYYHDLGTSVSHLLFFLVDYFLDLLSW